MNSVTIEAQVSPDRQLIYTLPPDVPIGRVKLVIQAIDEYPLTREEARRRLLAAGKLVTATLAPEQASPLSDAERTQLAELFGNGPNSTLDILNQERGSKT